MELQTRNELVRGTLGASCAVAPGSPAPGTSVRPPGAGMGRPARTTSWASASPEVTLLQSGAQYPGGEK